MHVSMSEPACAVFAPHRNFISIHSISFPPPPLTYYSVYAVTLTPQLQPQPYFPPNFLGLLFLVSPWVFQGFSCVVGFV